MGDNEYQGDTNKLKVAICVMQLVFRINSITTINRVRLFCIQIVPLDCIKKLWLSDQLNLLYFTPYRHENQVKHIKVMTSNGQMGLVDSKTFNSLLVSKIRDIYNFEIPMCRRSPVTKICNSHADLELLS